MKTKIKKKEVAKKEFEKIRIPKILSAIMVALLYLFVGDIFAENFQWGNFFIALIPGSIYLIIARIAWKRARLGGSLFVGLGIALVSVNVAQGRSALGPYVLAGITFILGFLFIKFGENKKITT